MELSTVIRSLASHIRSGRAHHGIVDATSARLEATSAALYVLDQHVEFLFLRAALGYARGMDDMALRARYRIGEGLTGTVAEDGKPLLIRSRDELLEHPRHMGKYREMEVVCNSLVAVPIAPPPPVMGVLKVEREVGKKPFDESDVETMETLGELAFLVLRGSPFPYRAFVAMPFGADDETLDRVYNGAIQAAAASTGVFCVRADECPAASHGELYKKIRDQIAMADLVLVDLTGNNVNVAHELGLAIAESKPVIPIRQKGVAGGVPSDYRHLDRLEYDPDDLAFLCLKLAERIRYVLRSVQPGERRYTAGDPRRTVG